MHQLKMLHVSGGTPRFDRNKVLEKSKSGVSVWQRDHGALYGKGGGVEVRANAGTRKSNSLNNRQMGDRQLFMHNSVGFIKFRRCSVPAADLFVRN